MIQDNYENADPSIGLAIVCEVCGKSISRLDYDRHLRTHREKRVEVCHICQKAFTNISNFKYHLAHHGNERPWLCNECPKNYKTKIDLLQHQRVHDKARDPFHCSICGQYFRTRSNFNTHQRTHSIKGPQKCNVCDKVFVNLRSHIQMVHQKIRHHICQICDKAFGKKSGLDRHIITVHEKMRCWACDLCEKSFGEKAQLLRHRKIHFKPTFEEPDPAQITEDQEVITTKMKRGAMKCGVCRKILNSRAALKRHKLLVHEKKKNLLCDFCPRLFGEKSNLMRHILKSHTKEANFERIKLEPGEIKEEDDFGSSPESNDVYQCCSCKRLLTTKWGLQAHEETCRIKKQKKLNEQKNDSDDDEKGFDDVDKMEEVFLVADDANESLEIKQERFADESLTEDLFVPVISLAEAKEPIEVIIKDEPYEIDEIPPSRDSTPIRYENYEMLEDDSDIDFRPDEIADAVESDRSEVSLVEDDLDDDDCEPAVTFLKRYKCKLCSSTFKEKRYFQSHFRTVHGKKKILKCNVDGCDENFIYRAQRLRHLRQKHPEFYEESDQDDDEVVQPSAQAELLECELCNSSFDSQKALNSHMIADHDENEVEDDEKKRTCETCEPPKVFKKTRYLLLHIQAVHSEQSFSCDQCPRTFSFKRSLDRHIKGVHENIRDFKCEALGCDKSFCNGYELKQHTTNSHNKGDKSDRTCKICFKVFKKVKYMEMHCASIHNSEPQFSCSICHRGFSFRRSMDRHIKAIHEDRRDFKCTSEGCERAFRSRYDLNEHFNNIHALIKKKRLYENVTCDVCEKEFSSRKVLYSHKKLVHEGVKWGLKFECKLCKENFESKYKKSKHWGQVHRNGKIKMRTCHLCNNEFQLFDDFKAHIESHIGYHICITCGLCLSDESSLFIHLETHRKIEEELRQFVCDVCSHRLSTKAQLLIHMRKHFSGDHYMCDVCGKSYKFIAPFLHHKMGHENRFDFPCNYCEKKFRVARDRMLHERTHTGERPYKCEQCQKAFAHKANYLSHLKTHEIKAYICKNCGLQLPSAAKLRQHEDNEHPEERPFRCCNCQKSFKATHSLETHKLKCGDGTNIDEKRAMFISS